MNEPEQLKSAASDTPRTDTVCFVGQCVWAEDNAPLLTCVEANFARQLERELNNARQAALTEAAEIAGEHVYPSNARQDILSASDKKGSGV